MGDKTKPAPKRAAGATNSRGRMAVPLDTRAEAEAVALWVEQLFTSYPEELARVQAWQRDHPDDKESIGRAAWLKNAIACGGMIAYFLRTHKIRGPL